MDSGQQEDKFARQRRRMVKVDLEARGINHPNVLKAMGRIRREQFVPEQYKSQAYFDGPLPIGYGQTISQPYIVALMTQHLQPEPDCEVLEIGTGCGYQTAVLSMLVRRVYTIERFNELSESAQAILSRLGVKNVEFHFGDGSCGWPDEKQFDRIMITAAVPQIPEPLYRQLADGGLVVAPIGAAVQTLVVAQKKKGKITKHQICGCRFVKLIGKHGFEE